MVKSAAKGKCKPKAKSEEKKSVERTSSSVHKRQSARAPRSVQPSMFEAGNAATATCSVSELEAQVVELDPSSVKITFSDKSGSVLKWGDAIRLLQTSAQFRLLLTGQLAQLSYKAFFWESRPFNQPRQKSIPFEFVVTSTADFDGMRPQSGSFAQHIGSDKDTTQVKSFKSLGGDATLVSPCHAAGTAPNCYTHLAAFLRGASSEQVDILWFEVGRAIAAEITTRGSNPLWVSTAGLGVAWLHVRLDSRPKYYTHTPFKTWELNEATDSRLL